MSATTKIAATACAFVAAGVAAKVLNDRQTERRRLRRGEDVPFGSVHSAARKVVSADGIRINVEIDEPDDDADDLPTIVFVHGIVCTLDTWHYQRLALRGRARMVFMDHRSHGESDIADREGSSIENLAADLHAVVDACTTGPVVLVGHSMGGMTILQLAADHPELFGDRVVGVALISTSPRLPLVANAALRRLVPVARRVAPAVDWGRGFNSYSVVRRWAVGPHAQERHADMTNEMILRVPTRVLTDFHPMFAELDVRHALETLSLVTTVVVAGTHDSVTPLSHSRRIADGIAGSSLVILDDTGHMAMFEEHVRVTELILDLAEKTAR
ncbi:alpha/beta fold hydrolase [Aeromicrobium sp.]|uniref:alpha/beta fold hydrolase n=1 Tax=Aeromicrobium sp. TaxID=1871063 RepID=UPI003D6ADC09